MCPVQCHGSGLPRCYQALPPAISRAPQVAQTILSEAATPQHTQHARKALPVLLLAVMEDAAQQYKQTWGAIPSQGPKEGGE